MKPTLLTTGVYGHTEASFFDALLNAGVDTFCDLRMRRGMRGRDYAFVNARRLEARLSDFGIRYMHFKELAPSAHVRAQQAAADAGVGEGKRSRMQLSSSFVKAYEDECLAQLDGDAFLRSLGAETRTAVLFCVEKEPSACHRSLLAEHLRHSHGLEVRHLAP